MERKTTRGVGRKGGGGLRDRKGLKKALGQNPHKKSASGGSPGRPECTDHLERTRNGSNEKPNCTKRWRSQNIQGVPWKKGKQA